MPKIYLPTIKTAKNTIIITDPNQIHHLKNVLRLKTNEKLLVFDRQGYEYKTIISEISHQSMKLTVTDCQKNLAIKNFKLTVACAIPKKSKFEDIIDKLTQLGVNRIIPLISERVIVKLNESKKIGRLRRWQKIALSAVEQSQRNDLPVINEIREFKDVLEESRSFDLKLIPCLVKERKPINQFLSCSSPRNIMVLIGPEGDFTPQEVKLAQSYGFIPVSLGDYVLRVETAAIAVASYLRFLFL